MRLVLILLTFSLAAETHADPRKDRVRCEEIKQEIRYIQSQMRAGYTRAKGEKLRAKLRKLRAVRRKACR